MIILLASQTINSEINHLLLHLQNVLWMHMCIDMKSLSSVSILFILGIVSSISISSVNIAMKLIIVGILIVPVLLIGAVVSVLIVLVALVLVVSLLVLVVLT